MNSRTFAIFLGSALAAAASAQFTFSNTLVNNVSLAGETALGSNGQSYVFTAASSKVQGANLTKTYTLRFDVANASSPLVGFTISPLGTAFRGSTKLTLDFGGGQTFLYDWSSPLSATSAISLGTRSGALVPAANYSVLATVQLNSLGNRFGTAALSQFNIAFDTAAVPEPASMAVLGVGIASFIRRRRVAR